MKSAKLYDEAIFCDWDSWCVWVDLPRACGTKDPQSALEFVELLDLVNDIPKVVSAVCYHMQMTTMLFSSHTDIECVMRLLQKDAV